MEKIVKIIAKNVRKIVEKIEGKSDYASTYLVFKKKLSFFKKSQNGNSKKKCPKVVFFFVLELKFYRKYFYLQHMQVHTLARNFKPSWCKMSITEAFSSPDKATLFYQEWIEDVQRTVPSNRLLEFDVHQGTVNVVSRKLNLIFVGKWEYSNSFKLK